MKIETTQERKDDLSLKEKQLRVAGQKLDSLWLEARNATGQARTDLHNQIGPLREKQRANRIELDAMKITDARNKN